MNAFFIVIVVFGVFLLLSSVRVVQEYERGVVFRLGRLAGLRGPGLILLIPGIERMVKVDAAYLKAHRAAVAEQLKRGGVRLAALLNRAFAQ